ncbi:MAG: DUF1961 family protein [Lentisphaeria bacterium]|nr:DUF1961 family protein [Lentisphaeria bacterium]
MQADGNKGKTLFTADFGDGASVLGDGWFLEGKGTADIQDGKLALQENGEGIVLWLKQDFPSDMRLEFDLTFGNDRGIGVFFFAARGGGGEDILQAVPPRDGAYGQYTRGALDCYGLSLHRFYPDGRHNAGSNLRRNSGFHLVNHVEPDPVQETGKTYRVQIEKQGARIRVWTDGALTHDWTDDGSFGAPLEGGKIGFRLRSDPSCIMYLDNITVVTLNAER